MDTYIQKIVRSIMENTSSQTTYPDGDPDGPTHGQVSWLVDKLHVGTPNHEVIAHVDRKLKGGLDSLPPDQKELVIKYALNAHARNQREYREVQSGRFGTQRRTGSPDQIYGDKRDIMDEYTSTDDLLDLHELLGQGTADRDARHAENVELHKKYGKDAISHPVSEKSKIVGLRSIASEGGKERIYYGQYGSDRNNTFSVKVPANKATHFDNIAKSISGSHRHISSFGIVDIAKEVAEQHGGHLMDTARAKGGRARVPFLPPDPKSKGPLVARLAANRLVNTIKAAKEF